MKNILEKKSFKTAVGGLALLSLGIFIGYQLNVGKIAFLQGYLFNAVGEATNATLSNATLSNATLSNATLSNATDANATTTNATLFDYVFYLYNAGFEDKPVTAGDKVNVGLLYYGAKLSEASILLKNETSGTTISANIMDINSNPYFIVPKNAIAGQYKVTDMLFNCTNSDNSTFSKHYSTTATDPTSSYLYFDQQLTVNALQTEEPLNLTSITITTLEAKNTEKVYLSYKTDAKLSSMKLAFKSEANEIMTVYVASLSSNPYFIVPSTIKSGNYELIKATISTSTASKIYGNNVGEVPFSFSSTLKINEDNTNKLQYAFNNEDIKDSIILDIYTADNSAKIEINADTNPIIDQELFNAIKGSNKVLTIKNNGNEIIFEGASTTEPKTIDASIVATTIDTETEIGSLVNQGIVVNFASNGELPGNALVRVKATDELKTTLGTAKVYVYYYNPSTQKFSLVAEEVTLSDEGYYEFNINHNSSYILVNEKLDKSLIDDGNNIITFLKSNKVYLLLIGAGVLLIIFVTTLIVVLKKKNVKKEAPTSTLE